nr:zinc finger domain-containing protein [Candidatus Sigynarchaeum springense]
MEGPSIKLVAERLQMFKNQAVSRIDGNARFEKARFVGQILESVFAVGKNLFLQFPAGCLRLHFLMYGRYEIDRPLEGKQPRLVIAFARGTFYFYNGAIEAMASQDVRARFDQSVDIMSVAFDEVKVHGLVKGRPGAFICDVLMDQDVFAGVGNIIKNEALFRAKMHPMARAGQLADSRIDELIRAARDYSILFYDQKRAGKSLRDTFQIYQKARCIACGGPVTREKAGEANRLNYYCPRCQPP